MLVCFGSVKPTGTWYCLVLTREGACQAIGNCLFHQHLLKLAAYQGASSRALALAYFDSYVVVADS